MDWTKSPCASCAHTPCCTHLPLHSFSINKIDDWEKGMELTSFPGIRLGLRSDGQFRVYLYRTCHHLKEDRLCSIHDTPYQSDICMDFSPHTCWYKRAFSPDNTDLLILLDRERLESLSSLLSWEADGSLKEAAPWDRLKKKAGFKTLNVEPFDDAWRQRAQFKSPAAILFPPGRPLKKEHWDLVRFRLGFPGVFISRPSGKKAEDDSPWAFIVTPDGFRPDLSAGEIYDPFHTGHDPSTAVFWGMEELNQFQGLD